ncbi:MAG: hypothetical protein ACWGKN_08710 [Desulfoprunum sp.]|jgi:hypothetical protein
MKAGRDYFHSYPINSRSYENAAITANESKIFDRLLQKTEAPFKKDPEKSPTA